MTQRAAEREASAAWTEVLELAAREESGRVLVERLLDLAESTGRVFDLPEGSPILVVPPPISTMGRWPQRCIQ